MEASHSFPNDWPEKFFNNSRLSHDSLPFIMHASLRGLFCKCSNFFWRLAKRPSLARQCSVLTVPPVRVGSVDFVQSVVEVEDCFLQDLTRSGFDVVFLEGRIHIVDKVADGLVW